MQSASPLRRILWLLASLSLLVALAPAASAARSATPNDEHYDLQWGLQQIKAEQAWSTSTGRRQVIAVVDTGIDLRHPDLRRKIVGGATFVGCPEQPNGCGDGDWRSGEGDPHPHGTHVAGIAAAVTGNGEGIAGAAPAARLLAVKVLSADGGSFEEVAAGIRWSADNGADVINLSLGALPGFQALPLVGELDDTKQAINYAVSRGVAVIAAAGNDFVSICGEPAFNPNALCVAATDRNELRASYSNFALDQDLNVVAAPGGAAFLSCEEDVISAVPSDAESFCTDAVGTPGYDFYAGTSMATPHVAGAAALLTAQGRDVFQVYEVLKDTARNPVTGLRGVFDPVYGYGIIDAEAAVRAPIG